MSILARITSYEVTALTRKHIVLTTTYGKAKQEKTHIIVMLEDEQGHRGYGEATPLSKFSGETSDIVKLVLERELLPLVLGLDSADIAVAHQCMDKHIYGNNAAKCAIDCAMYDLFAKTLQVPLYKLLGGCVRKQVPINRHIGIESVEQAKSLALNYLKQGFQSIKMKVGNDIEEDSKRIWAVRDILGDSGRIRIDGNNGMSFSTASKLIELVKECDLEFYEQLLPKWDLEGMRALHQKFGISIATDEAVNSIQDAAQYAVAGAAEAFVIKLVKCGGLYPALGIAALANSYRMPVIITSTYDTQIGCATCLHLACTLPNANTACDLTAFAVQPEMAHMAHQLNKMHMACGDAPGIGVFNMQDFTM